MEDSKLTFDEDYFHYQYSAYKISLSKLEFFLLTIRYIYCVNSGSDNGSI